MRLLKIIIAFVVVLPVLAATAILFRPQIQTAMEAVEQQTTTRKTVAQRVEQYGATVRARLAPDFQKAGIAYPAKKLVLIGLKSEERLEAWAAGEDGNYKLLRAYPVLAASGVLGPKLRQGDRQVPEGLYRIESLNPNSLYHLSLRVNYPNEFDRRQAAREERKNLGGDIMIHGRAVSIGCLAVGDEAAEDLFVLAAETGVENTKVILSPVDFRRRELPADAPPVPAWMPGLYENIKSEMHRFK